ncbi:MAG: hypothetical protein ACM3Q2_16510 [Syntrophothermus sp.]
MTPTEIIKYAAKRWVFEKLSYGFLSRPALMRPKNNPMAIKKTFPSISPHPITPPKLN